MDILVSLLVGYADEDLKNLLCTVGKTNLKIVKDH
jgi:hypothetical protein